MSDRKQYEQLPLYFDKPIKTKLLGRQVIDNPFLNKGTCFSSDERGRLGLHGLLPTNVQTLDQQVARAYQQYQALDDDLQKNTFMASLASQGVVLYHRLVADHVKDMLSIIYTPTEGDAIQNYSRIFRKPDGCFLPITHPDEVEQRLARFVVESGDGSNGVDYIVVSDGEEILGIGDQGIGGILISVAKLALTTVCAGVHPERTLAVVLDTGTDNEGLLNDDLYLGYKHPRVRGQQYDNFVETFVQAVNKLFPQAYLHFEDFGVTNARQLLDRYQDRTACFNDDIQGTGCVTLAAIQAALKISKVELSDLRLVVFGSGSAGCGIANMVVNVISADAGVSEDQVRSNIWCVDKDGLLFDDMELSIAQKPFAKGKSDWSGKDTKSLQSIIAEVKPHALIGTSTKPGAFTQGVVEEMAKHVDRPIIFPLSNPTRLHEAQPDDIAKWTNGKALIATGSPFPPIKHDCKEIEIAECNNSVCFPGIGLGAVLCRATRVTDKMLAAGVKALAEESPALKDETRGLVPDVEQARPVSTKIAMAIIRTAQEEGVARVENIPNDDKKLKAWVESQMWQPVYREIQKVE